MGEGGGRCLGPQYGMPGRDGSVPTGGWVWMGGCPSSGQEVQGGPVAVAVGEAVAGEGPVGVSWGRVMPS